MQEYTIKGGQNGMVAVENSERKREHPLREAHMLSDMASLDEPSGRFSQICNSLTDFLYARFPNLPFYTIKIPG